MESSILSAACSLRSIVPKEIVSPFCNTNSTATATARATFSVIKSTLLAFERDILMKPESGVTERYLSLLRESAGSGAVLLNHQADNNLASLILKSARQNRQFPILSTKLLSSSGENRSLQLLKYLAATELEFDVFSENLENLPFVTISLGAKTMVIDFEVKPTGQISRIKFSYSFGDHAGGSAPIDRLLLQDLESFHLLGTGIEPCTVEEESERERLMEVGLKRVYNLLRELKRLDSGTEKQSRDLFEASKVLQEQMNTFLLSQGPDSISRLKSGVGIPSLNSLSLGLTLLYHLSPARLLSLPSDPNQLESSLSSTFELRKLLEHSGTFSATISVDTPASGRSESFPYIAHFSPSIVVSKSTGKRINMILGLVEKSATTLTKAGENNHPVATGIEDYLLEKSFDGNDVYQVENPLIKQTYELSNRGKITGFTLSEIRFSTPAQLQQIILIVKDQIFVNESFQSIFNHHHRKMSKSDEDWSGERSLKKQKMTLSSVEELLSQKPLDNLPISVELSSTSNALSLSFPSPHTRPSQAFPITVTFTAQYHSTHAQATESVTKLPLLSIHLGRLSTEASMHDNLTAEKDRESRLEARITSSKGIEQLSKVFETSRDLSLVMRLILKKLLIV